MDENEQDEMTTREQYESEGDRDPSGKLEH